eukprot:CAMPEP_0173383040 /NCGR_PEP_ID=MMETSP1356-20130122/5557_1 /TAXON_ID=77927 ORGANISM="Hemiselmis virescens, Strain PCC157" /NCGR_SAMPLE_ID=MMETSP1356 /ASSEMBLY_ACC=CAM_ASM_000847 /LENGTH=83 /DNA_ID=CAMNT_0014337681 /DNA_START=138 /DNA_END=390 /DNA_ORIENTATION=-
MPNSLNPRNHDSGSEAQYGAQVLPPKHVDKPAYESIGVLIPLHSNEAAAAGAAAGAVNLGGDFWVGAEKGGGVNLGAAAGGAE